MLLRTFSTFAIVSALTLALTAFGGCGGGSGSDTEIYTEEELHDIYGPPEDTDETEPAVPDV